MPANDNLASAPWAKRRVAIDSVVVGKQKTNVKVHPVVSVQVFVGRNFKLTSAGVASVYLVALFKYLHVIPF